MNTHRIQRVAKLVGLSKDVIRVWEKRYGLVKPLRSANRYREYTDSDVALLRFLKQELDHGQTIGALAVEGLDALVQRMRTSPAGTAQELKPHESLLDELTALLDPLDKARFEQKLNGAVAVIPFEEAVQRILLPLQRRVGDLWHEGKLNVAVEHYVTKLIQQKLFSVMNQLSINESGPRIVVACPEGESHEIGAQAVAYLAAVRGCHVYYLGPNLPAVRACGILRAREARSRSAFAHGNYLGSDCSPLFSMSLGLSPPNGLSLWAGKDARTIDPHLLNERKIGLLDDLTALHNRIMTLISNRMLASMP